MESPLKKYKTLLEINNINDLAYDTLFTKYIIENLKGEEKVRQIDSTDQESLMRRVNGGYPLPGFVYTFIYPPQPGDEVVMQLGNSEKRYIDYIPIMFCTRTDGHLFKGINFNALPNQERVKFLEIYWSEYKSFFKDIEKETENDKLAINNKYINLASSNQGQGIVDLFSRKASANFNFAFRSYNMQKVKQLRMVEYSEWDYIPFYDPKNAFKKMNQKQIHDLYWKMRGNI